MKEIIYFAQKQQSNPTIQRLNHIKILMGKQVIDSDINSSKKQKKSKVDKQWFSDAINFFIQRQKEFNQNIYQNANIKKTPKKIQNDQISNASIEKQSKDKLKRCKSCYKWNELKSIIQCQLCQDYFHKKCINSLSQNRIVCFFCQNGHRAIKCNKCLTMIQSQQMNLQCSSCLFYFHAQCMNGKQMCQKCLKIHQDINHQAKFKQLSLQLCFSTVNIKQTIKEERNSSDSNRIQYKNVLQQSSK